MKKIALLIPLVAVVLSACGGLPETIPGPTVTVTQSAKPAPAVTVPGPTTTVPGPTTTVPGPAVTVPGPTVTAPAPTVTVTAQAAPNLGDTSDIDLLAIEVAWEAMSASDQADTCALYNISPDTVWYAFNSGAEGSISRAAFDDFFSGVC